LLIHSEPKKVQYASPNRHAFKVRKRVASLHFDELKFRLCNEMTPLTLLVLADEPATYRTQICAREEMERLCELTRKRSTRWSTVLPTRTGRADVSAKGRDKRPGRDLMLTDEFDVGMSWAIDRLGRPLVDLRGTIQGFEACGVDLYLDQQAIDTTTPTQA
jgi:hypothetical protein